LSSTENIRDARRKFGLVFSLILTVIALISLWRGRESWVWGSLLGLAAFFLVSSLLAPVLLAPFYAGMLRLSRYMGWLNTRIILIVLYYLIFTPVALIYRIVGRDPLSRKFEPEKQSYWIKKERDDRDVASHFEKQF
jgi:hypothetical protein